MKFRKRPNERNAALDALTVTQEEWFLRVKNLEIENYDLKQKLEAQAEGFCFAAQKLIDFAIDPFNTGGTYAICYWDEHRPKK